ncbi:MAG TPA: L-threonylcarbamoyladenylate synthase [Nitrososphaera sp.]|nr:L-threonylcarbamoyladenylate synthase [Nitrososphaera sp.]
MEVVKCTAEGVLHCSEVVRRGGVIVFPTDTVYGIGCDPRNSKAVSKVFELKHREKRKPLPVLVHDKLEAVKMIDMEKAKDLASRYWPGPLTIVAPLLDSSIVPALAAGTEKLGVRVPANKCILDLLYHCRILVGTSANLSGHAPPKSAGEVLASGLEGFDVLLDGGHVEGGRESTIVDIMAGNIVREGAISGKDVLDVLRVSKR